MERINQYAFYELGHALHRIAEFEGDAILAGDILFEIFEASNKMGQLLEGRPIQLGVSRVRARELHGGIERLLDRYFKTDNEKGERVFKMPEGDKTIPGWEWNALKHSINSFETVFREEMREAATYLVPSRGIFDTAKLVDAADTTFPANLLPHIPDKAKDEWKGAGRCLAFGLLSASGFHVARSVEGMLETYMEAFGVKCDKLKSWGEYLGELEKLEKSTPAPDLKTVSEIRQMKDDWRNPLMHPRVVLSESEARMLFANGESLIIAMAAEVEKVKQVGIQPALALAATGTDG